MTTLPYLPQELWDLIYDIKFDIEWEEAYQKKILEIEKKRDKLAKDFRQLRKTYESIINFDSIKLIKDNIREINKNIDKRIKLSQNKYDLAMELINLDAKDMGWTTSKTNNGYAIDFHNERYGGPFYFKKFLYSDYYNFFIT